MKLNEEIAGNETLFLDSEFHEEHCQTFMKSKVSILAAHHTGEEMLVNKFQTIKVVFPDVEKCLFT